MRVGLEQLNGSGMTLSLPVQGQASPHVIRIERVEGVAGVVESHDGDVEVRDARATSLELTELGLHFDEVDVQAIGTTTLDQPSLDLRQSDHLRMKLAVHHLHTPLLRVQVGELTVEAETHLGDASVDLRGEEGQINATNATFRNFRLQSGDVRLESDELSAADFHIAWGKAGFRLVADRWNAGSVSVGAGVMQLAGQGFRAEKLTVLDADVTLTAAHVDQSSMTLQLDSEADEAAPEQPPPEPHSPKEPIWEWRTLDGVDGHVHVDVDVDLTLPIFGRRRATHRLRIPVQRGALDYRELEDDLSALEGSLLDFAVREGSLVLERGIPLLPTRGMGKRILIWKLSDADLALARQRRVRLAVLPSFRQASELEEARQHEAQGSTAPSVALRRLGLDNIDVDLSLAAADAPLGAVLSRLAFKRLTARGDLHYLPEESAQAGHVDVTMKGVEGDLLGLPVGEQTLRLRGFALDEVPSARVDFNALTPTTATLQVSGLGCEHFSLSHDS